VEQLYLNLFVCIIRFVNAYRDVEICLCASHQPTHHQSAVASSDFKRDIAGGSGKNQSPRPDKGNGAPLLEPDLGVAIVGERLVARPGSTGPSPKRRRGVTCLWAHHLQGESLGSGALYTGR